MISCTFNVTVRTVTYLVKPKNDNCNDDLDDTCIKIWVLGRRLESSLFENNY